MAAIAAWLPLLGMPARGWLDFSAFYAAGALAFGPQVLDLRAMAEFQAMHGLPNTPFLYPPGLALAYVPFAAVPYDIAAAFHVVLQALALAAAAALGSHVFGIPWRWALLGTVAWSPAAAAVVSGQNTAVLLLLTVIAAYGLASVIPGRGAMARRKGSIPGRGGAIAGLVVGMAGYRPHLGLPLLGLAFWRRARLAVAVAILPLAAQYVLGVVATGGQLDWPVRWLSAVGAETANDFQSVGWQAIGLPGILGRLSIAGSSPGSLLGPALLGFLIGVALIVSSLGSLRRWDAPRAIALTCSLALFAGPRGFAYDGAMLLPAIAVLARDAMDRHWPWEYRWLLAAAYGIALAWPFGGFIGLNPLAIVVLAAPVVLLGRGPFRGIAQPDDRAVSIGILGRP
jgi:hypothetical protein